MQCATQMYSSPKVKSTALNLGGSVSAQVCRCTQPRLLKMGTINRLSRCSNPQHPPFPARVTSEFLLEEIDNRDSRIVSERTTRGCFNEGPKQETTESLSIDIVQVGYVDTYSVLNSRPFRASKVSLTRLLNWFPM